MTLRLGRFAPAFFAVALFGIASPATAFDANDDVEFWYQAQIQTRLQAPGAKDKGSWMLWAELQPRLSLTGNVDHVGLFRSGIGAEIVPGLSAWIGFAGIPRYRAPAWEADEFRLFQQLLFIQNIESFNLVWRGRLEQRAFPDRKVPIRGRAMVRAMWRPADFLSGQHGLVVWDEPFITFDGVDGAAEVGFDQNRFFAGVRFVPIDHLLVEVGYLNIVIGAPGPDTGVMRHAAFVSTIIDFL